MFFTDDYQEIAIYGLGGVGKTQIAREFANKVKEIYTDYSILWVSALSQSSFEQAFQEIAAQLPIPYHSDPEERKQAVKRFLSQDLAGHWMFILDNADDRDIIFGRDGIIGLINYIPKSSKGRILYTTRNRELAYPLGKGEMIEIMEMAKEDAVKLFEISLKGGLTSNTKEDLDILLHELTCLPLAIVQSAAYICCKRIALKKYLELLQGTENDAIALLSKDFYSTNQNYESKKAVAATWLISFEQIRKDDSVAAELLSFMSFLEYKAIPSWILQGNYSEETMASAIGTLSAYSFIIRSENDTLYDLHRLVHLATRNWLQLEGIATFRVEEVIGQLNKKFRYSKYKTRDGWNQGLPHVLKALGQPVREDLEDRIELCRKTGQILCSIGKYREGIGLLVDVFNRRASLAEDHPDRLTSQHDLANAYQKNGQVKEAITLLEHVVKIHEVLAVDHPDRLTSQHSLASAYRINGQVSEAIVLLEHVVKIREEVLPEGHPHRLKSQHALAKTYRINGQFRDAVILLKHIIKIHEEVLTEDHPGLLASQHSLANAYRENGQVREAIMLLENVVKIREEVLPKDHPHRLISQYALAKTYQKSGRVSEAIALLKHVVKIREEVLAEDHPDRLMAQHALAKAHQENGQGKEAIVILEHVVKIREEVLVEGHPSRLKSQHTLANAYRENGQIREAIRLLENVFRIHEEVLAEDHPDRLGCRRLLREWTLQASHGTASPFVSYTRETI